MYELLLKKIVSKINILKKEDVGSFVESLYIDYSKSFPITEEQILSKDSKFLLFDYRKHGFSYIDGKICCAGISMIFRKEGYSHLNVTVSYDKYKDDICNYALLVPVYKDCHWIDRKSIAQQANIIRSDKDFERYKKKIDKKFDVIDKNTLQRNEKI
jgi:hypothetical protein